MCSYNCTIQCAYVLNVAIEISKIKNENYNRLYKTCIKTDEYKLYVRIEIEEYVARV